MAPRFVDSSSLAVLLCVSATQLGCYASHQRTEPLEPDTGTGEMRQDADFMEVGSDIDALGPVRLPLEGGPIGTPLCLPDLDAAMTVSTWADERGLFLLVVDRMGRSRVLAARDGAWESWFDRTVEPRPRRIRGVAGGPLFLWPSRCSVLRLDSPDVPETCVEIPDDRGDTTSISDAWPLGRDHLWVVGPPISGYAYAQEWNAGTVELASYLELDDVVGMWGDRVGAFVASRERVFGISDGFSGPRGDVPLGPYVALWAETRDELGLATEGGEVLRLVSASGWLTERTALRNPLAAAGAPGLVAIAERGAIAVGTPGSIGVVAAWSDPRVHVASLAVAGPYAYVTLQVVGVEDVACGPLAIFRVTADGTVNQM